jgi:hypothetical protein
VLASLHREGAVISSVDGERGVRVRARLSEASAGRVAAFVVDADADAEVDVEAASDAEEDA